MVPGGCASVRQTMGDILSTANVVTAAATQTKSLPKILGEPPPQTGPNEIAPGPNLIRGRRHGARGRETARQRNGREGRRGVLFRRGKQRKQRQGENGGSEKERDIEWVTEIY